MATNPLANGILSLNDGLYVHEGCLQPALHGNPGHGLKRISRPSGNPPWLVWVTTLHNGVPSPGYHAVSIFDFTRRPQVNRALLRAAFDLTRAELDLAEQLILGRKPQEAAEALGVTIHTVRTYLKRLFNRVGVHTQAKLVGKLLQVIHSLPEE